jgi:hypothetical protein
LVRKPAREKINRPEDSGIGERIILRFILIKGMGDVEWILLILGKDGWLTVVKTAIVFDL